MADPVFRPLTLAAALSQLDRVLVDVATLRTRITDMRGEIDNVYALLRSSTAHQAALAVEMEQGHAEREQLRESLANATRLVAELTEDRAALRRQVESRLQGGG